MGKNKKKNKKKSAEKKEALRERREKKLLKKANKRAKQEADAMGTSGVGFEDDCKARIREFLSRKADGEPQMLVQSCESPTPRSFSSLFVLPSGDIGMWGGEWWDGRNTNVFADFLTFRPGTQEWRNIINSKSPPPRASHSITVVREKMYCFGGEYSTTHKFHHYGDFWEYDFVEKRWFQIEAQGNAPSQRSGHRMVLWRHYLILFGGFYDVSGEMDYKNDTYLFCLKERRWKLLTFGKFTTKPAPRSSPAVAVFGDTMYVYGGFVETRLGVHTTKCQYFTDVWALTLNPGKGIADVTGTWSSVQAKGLKPPNRFVGAYCVHKKKMVFFGGLGTSEDAMDSDSDDSNATQRFHNDLFAFDMERKRFFKLNMRRKKNMKSRRRRREKPDIASETANQEQDNSIGEENTPEPVTITTFDDICDENHYLIEAGAIFQHSKPVTDSLTKHGNPGELNSQDILVSVLNAEAESKSSEAYALKTIPTAEFPPPRFKASACIIGNIFYLFGGLIEEKKKERIALDDLWTIDLNKLDGWKCVKADSGQGRDWKGNDADKKAKRSGKTPKEQKAEDPKLQQYDGDVNTQEIGNQDDDGAYFVSDDDDAPDDLELLSHLHPDVLVCMSKQEIGIAAAAKRIEIGLITMSENSDVRDADMHSRSSLLATLGFTNSESIPHYSEDVGAFFTRTADYWMSLYASEIAASERGEGQKQRILQGLQLKEQIFSMAKSRYLLLLPLNSVFKQLAREEEPPTPRGAEEKTQGTA